MNQPNGGREETRPQTPEQAGDPASQAGGGAPRFHDLDALRAVAMLLGIVLHAAIFFIPELWPVYEEEDAQAADGGDFYAILLLGIHGFRMPVFFLLSGFFTAMLWQRRGLRSLGVHRLKRIGLPLLIGCFTILPLDAWLFREGEPPLTDLLLAWTQSFDHLWFLWILLWLAALFIVAARLGVGFTHKLWWLAVPLVLVPQLLMSEDVFGPDTSEGLLVDPVVLGYYALFFAFGAFAYRRNIEMPNWWVVAMLPAMFLFLVGLGLYEAEGEWVWAVSAVIQAAYAWMMSLGMIGLFRWIAMRERPWVRYLSDSSYWLYLWHLPLIFVGVLLLQDWPVSVHLKFLLLCVTAPALLLVTYQYGVRYTLIGTMLNGKRTRPRRNTRV